MGCYGTKERPQQVAYQRDFLGACWDSPRDDEAAVYVRSRWLGVSKRVMQLSTRHRCFVVRAYRVEERTAATAAAAAADLLAQQQQQQHASPLRVRTGDGDLVDVHSFALGPRADIARGHGATTALPAVLASSDDVASNKRAAHHSHHHGGGGAGIAAPHEHANRLHQQQQHNQYRNSGDEDDVAAAMSVQSCSAGERHAGARNTALMLASPRYLVSNGHLSVHGSVGSMYAHSAAADGAGGGAAAAVVRSSSGGEAGFQIAHAHNTRGAAVNLASTTRRQEAARRRGSRMWDSALPAALGAGGGAGGGGVDTLQRQVHDTTLMERLTHNAHVYLRANGLSVLQGVVFRAAPARRRYTHLSLVLDAVAPQARTALLASVRSAAADEAQCVCADYQQQLRAARGAQQQQEEQKPASARAPPLSSYFYGIEERDVDTMTATSPPVVVGSVSALELLCLPLNAEVCLGGWLYVSLEDEQARLQHMLESFVDCCARVARCRRHRCCNNNNNSDDSSNSSSSDDDNDPLSPPRHGQQLPVDDTLPFATSAHNNSSSSSSSSSSDGDERARRQCTGDGGAVHCGCRRARQRLREGVWLPNGYVVVALPMYECAIVPTAFHREVQSSKPVSLNVASSASRRVFGVGCVTAVRYGGVVVLECRDRMTHADLPWLTYLASLRNAKYRVSVHRQGSHAGDSSSSSSSSDGSSSSSSSRHTRMRRTRTPVRTGNDNNNTGLDDGFCVYVDSSPPPPPHCLRTLQHSIVHELTHCGFYVVVARTTRRTDTAARCLYNNDTTRAARRNNSSSNSNEKDDDGDGDDSGDDDAQASFFVHHPPPAGVQVRAVYRQLGGVKCMDVSRLRYGCEASYVAQCLRLWLYSLLQWPIKARPLSIFLQRYEGLANALLQCSMKPFILGSNYATLSAGTAPGPAQPPVTNATLANSFHHVDSVYADGGRHNNNNNNSFTTRRGDDAVSVDSSHGAVAGAAAQQQQQQQQQRATLGNSFASPYLSLGHGHEPHNGSVHNGSVHNDSPRHNNNNNSYASAAATAAAAAAAAAAPSVASVVNNNSFDMATLSRNRAAAQAAAATVLPLAPVAVAYAFSTYYTGPLQPRVRAVLSPEVERLLRRARGACTRRGRGHKRRDNDDGSTDDDDDDDGSSMSLTSKATQHSHTLTSVAAGVVHHSSNEDDEDGGSSRRRYCHRHVTDNSAATTVARATDVVVSGGGGGSNGNCSAVSVSTPRPLSAGKDNNNNRTQQQQQQPMVMATTAGGAAALALALLRQRTLTAGALREVLLRAHQPQPQPQPPLSSTRATAAMTMTTPAPPPTTSPSSLLLLANNAAPAAPSTTQSSSLPSSSPHGSPTSATAATTMLLTRAAPSVNADTTRGVVPLLHRATSAAAFATDLTRTTSVADVAAATAAAAAADGSVLHDVTGDEAQRGAAGWPYNTGSKEHTRYHRHHYAHDVPLNSACCSSDDEAAVDDAVQQYHGGTSNNNNNNMTGAAVAQGADTDSAAAQPSSGNAAAAAAANANNNNTVTAATAATTATTAANNTTSSHTMTATVSSERAEWVHASAVDLCSLLPRRRGNGYADAAMGVRAAAAAVTANSPHSRAMSPSTSHGNLYALAAQTNDAAALTSAAAAPAQQQAAMLAAAAAAALSPTNAMLSQQPQQPLPLTATDEWLAADREVRALKDELDELRFLVSNARTSWRRLDAQLRHTGALLLPHTRVEQLPLLTLFLTTLRQFPDDVPVKELNADWLPMLLALITVSRAHYVCRDDADDNEDDEDEDEDEDVCAVCRRAACAPAMRLCAACHRHDAHAQSSGTSSDATAAAVKTLMVRTLLPPSSRRRHQQQQQPLLLLSSPSSSSSSSATNALAVRDVAARVFADCAYAHYFGSADVLDADRCRDAYNAGLTAYTFAHPSAPLPPPSVLHELTIATPPLRCGAADVAWAFASPTSPHAAAAAAAASPTTALDALQATPLSFASVPTMTTPTAAEQPRLSSPCDAIEDSLSYRFTGGSLGVLAGVFFVYGDELLRRLRDATSPPSPSTPSAATSPRTPTRRDNGEEDDYNNNSATTARGGRRVRSVTAALARGHNVFLRRLYVWGATQGGGHAPPHVARDAAVACAPYGAVDMNRYPELTGGAHVGRRVVTLFRRRLRLRATGDVAAVAFARCAGVPFRAAEVFALYDGIAYYLHCHARVAAAVRRNNNNNTHAGTHTAQQQQQPLVDRFELCVTSDYYYKQKQVRYHQRRHLTANTATMTTAAGTAAHDTHTTSQKQTTTTAAAAALRRLRHGRHPLRHRHGRDSATADDTTRAVPVVRGNHAHTRYGKELPVNEAEAPYCGGEETRQRWSHKESRKLYRFLHECLQRWRARHAGNAHAHRISVVLL